MNSKVAGYAAFLLCVLAVPVLMGNQEWDDHDRSHKTIARDLAIDYLESCAPNAILIAYGDNDTYPLWYAQEVEGIRRDVRVINQSILATDWYINELRYKVNKSGPIDPLWDSAQVEGVKREEIYYSAEAGVDPNQYMDLYKLMHDYAGSDDSDKVLQRPEGILNIYPTKNVIVPVDTSFVRQNGTINMDDSVLPELKFTIPQNIIYKNDAAILNIIAANHWKRPIYFTQQKVGLGFDQYLRQDGLTFRLVPAKKTNADPNTPDVNAPWVLDKMMNKFAFGNCETPGVYYDEENRRHLMAIRLAYATAAGILAEKGKKEEATQLLEKCDKNMSAVNFPYGMVSRNEQHDYFSIWFLEAAYKAGDTTLATKVSKSLQEDFQQQLNYFASLSDERQEIFKEDNELCVRYLNGLQQLEKEYKTPEAGSNAVKK